LYRWGSQGVGKARQGPFTGVQKKGEEGVARKSEQKGLGEEKGGRRKARERWLVQNSVSLRREGEK